MELIDLVFRTHHRDGFPALGGSLPLLGHMPYMYRGSRKVYTRARAELGHFFWVRNRPEEWSLVCVHPEGIAVLRTKSANVSHYKEIAAPLLGDSILTHDGPQHAHERGAMNGPFTPRGLSAADVGPVIADTIAKRVDALKYRDSLRILAETRELALDVIFGMIGIPARDLPDWRHHYEEYLLNAIRTPVDKMPGSPRWRGKRAQKWLDDKLMEAVREARSNPDAKGMLAHLVRAKDEHGEALSDHEVLENLRLVALAGHETTATTMAWMVIEACGRPDVWTRLVEEANAAADLPRTPADLHKFPYAEAVFREALRLHPPVAGVSRRVTGPLTIAGREIPVGVELTLMVDTIARDASVYPDPESFKPDRWLAKKEPPSALDLSQFGGGVHFCIGYHVAWMESVVFIVALARALSARGQSPKLVGDYPATLFMPLAHPDPKTHVRFARA